MLLGIDVGNTNVTLGRLADGEVGETWRLPTQPAATVGDTEAAIESLVGLDRVSEVVMASVVPALSATLTELMARRGIRLLTAGPDTIPIPMRVERPAEVGADRLVNAYAALRLHGAPAIVVDFGTATTFDVVDAGGAYAGGAIAPGIELGLEALATRTALLPRVRPDLPERAIGTNTVTAIQSGTVIGHIGLVRELLARIQGEIGSGATVVMTGGLAQAGWVQQAFDHVVDADLTLRGLAILHVELAAAPPASIRA